MTQPWEADRVVSAGEAARLVETQFPQLAPAQPVPFGVGWDNTAYLIRERWVFRFPRRPVAAGLIARERQALPHLAPRLPLPVPIPAFAGAPTGEYPYPFAGYALLPGTTACRLDWTRAQRARTAALLARFLAALHAVPVTAETRAWASGDDLMRADMARRLEPLKARLRALPAGLAEIDAGALCDLADRLAQAPAWNRPACWVHGDLYARHLLVDADRLPCGVIDWGDTHLGDPALDLSLAFSFLPPEARPAFRQAYGPIETATWDRARFRALHYGAILLPYAVAVGEEALRAAGEYALRSAAL